MFLAVLARTSRPSCLQQVLRHVVLEVLEQGHLLVEGLRVGAQAIELLSRITVDVLHRPVDGEWREESQTYT